MNKSDDRFRWLHTALPIGVALCGRPLVDSERFSQSTLFTARDESVYTCYGDSSVMLDRLSCQRLAFDGAFVLGSNDSPSQLYFDAAFRSQNLGEQDASVPTSQPVWSIQDAISAAIAGVADVCIFTYGGHMTGKSTTLRRVMLLAAQDIRRKLATSPAAVCLHATEYRFDENDVELIRTLYTAEQVDADQLPSVLWHEFHRGELANGQPAPSTSHFVWSMVFAHGSRIIFADTCGASRVTPKGLRCEVDLSIFSLEQAALHTVEHMQGTAFTRSIACGVGGHAIGIALCCFGQTAFHYFHENAQTFQIARSLMRIVNPIRLAASPSTTAATSLSEFSQAPQLLNDSALGELCSLRRAYSPNVFGRDDSKHSVIFYD